MAACFPSTAEQVVAVVEAVRVKGATADAEYVVAFVDSPAERAKVALALAAALGFLDESNGEYRAASPLCRFVAASGQQRAASVLRIALESYEPFVAFRERLVNTTDGTTAARHTKAKLELDGHHDEIRDTLVSLGTYSHALTSAGGGQYTVPTDQAVDDLREVAEGCADLEAAQSLVAARLGESAAEMSARSEVLEPLAEALVQAKNGQASGAVQQAGNAVEAYLGDFGDRLGTSVSSVSGINGKLERIHQNHPVHKKLVRVSKYVGDIRNAADHGPDADAGGQSWNVRETTGVEYVFVAIGFLRSLAAWENGEPPTV